MPDPDCSGLIEIDTQNVDLWKNLAIQLTTFLNTYKVYINSYVLELLMEYLIKEDLLQDFFVNNLFEEVPEKWREVLKTFSMKKLAQFINYSQAPLEPFHNYITTSGPSVLPLSLLAFRATCCALTLPRNPIKNAKPIKSYLNRLTCESKKKWNSAPLFLPMSTLHEWMQPLKELSTNGGQHCMLQHVFRKHLKPKKQHEIVRMSQIASMAVQATSSKVVVDVGSGQGHLSRLISYGYEIPTVCLDNQQNFINGARKFDKQLEKSLKHQFKNVEEENNFFRKGPRHSICHLSANTSQDEISNLIKNLWPELASDNETPYFGIMGLHSCGNLAPFLIKIFTEAENCRTLLSVSCCYMKLSVEGELYQNEDVTYPMSDFMSRFKSHSLSYVAREMSCHALEAYAQKLSQGADNLKVHCYRAVIEQLIVTKNPSLAHSGLRSIKNAHLMAFLDYGPLAVSRLEGIEFTHAELCTDIVENQLSKWEEVVLFYSLRLMLAPVIETLILIDRALFLHQKGFSSFIAPIFDPVLSPRNFILLARK